MASTSLLRGFNDLPPELKSEIVALVAEQDEAFKAWSKEGGRVILAKQLKMNVAM